MPDPRATGAILVEGMTQKAAAKALGVNRRTVDRICRGEIRSLTPGTLTKFRRHLPKTRLAAFDRTLLPPKAQVELAAYRFWMAEYSDYDVWNDDGELGAPGQFELKELAGYRDSLGKSPSVRSRLQSLNWVLKALNGLQEGKALRDFIDWAKKRKLEKSRVLVAFRRALQPLVDAMGIPIERSMKELLDQGQLQRYVDLAFARERLLLNREPTVVRAQRSKGPMES